jgi:hypothetical protein
VRWRVGVPLLVVALFCLPVWLAARHSGPSCAGQCKAPFQLLLMFPPGTPSSTIHQVEANCRHEPGVVGYATEQHAEVDYYALTAKMAVSPGLAACLHRQRPSLEYGYPD